MRNPYGEYVSLRCRVTEGGCGWKALRSTPETRCGKCGHEMAVATPRAVQAVYKKRRLARVRRPDAWKKITASLIRCAHGCGALLFAKQAKGHECVRVLAPSFAVRA